MHDEKDIFAHADKLNKEKYAGFSDWRVPTIAELKTLLTKKPLAKNRVNFYWPSSTCTDNELSAYGIDIIYPGVLDDYKGNGNYIRCVRNR